MGGSFLSDETGQNQNKDMAFVAKLTEMIKEKENDPDIPHIEFASSHPEFRMTPKSAYDSSDFFTASFPTLFPWGSGGHIDFRRKEEVSLKAWAK